MQRTDGQSKGPQRQPARRMSIFTASQTMRTAAGWSIRTRSDRRDSRRGSILRRDSVRTDGSSLQQTTKTLVRLENTYRTRPDDGTSFKDWKIKSTMEEILKETLEGKTYDPNETPRLGLQIASMVKTSCKDMGCPRYKLVAHVVIGQNLNQSLEAASRGIWDNDLDAFVCATFQNETIFAVATVFALYYE